VLAAVSEYANNNSGVLPATCSGTNPITVGVAPGATSEAKVGYYNSGCSVSVAPAVGHVGFTTGAHAAAVNDSVIITTGASCNAAGAAIGGSARSVAALYEI